jgi:ribonuclease E
MESPKHIRQVERCFAEAMGRDKARYDITRISKLGLMEVSRQRIKVTKASSSFTECPTCQGDGTVRTPEAAARMAFRKIQARVVKGDIAGVKVFLPPDVALHLLNHKRDDLARLETRHRVRVEVEPEERMKASEFEVEEIRREESEIMPIVTADTVDEALVAGSLPTTARPPESSAVAPAPETETRPGPGPGAERPGRRRRRRGRGRGAEARPPRQDGGGIAGEPAGPAPMSAGPANGFEPGAGEPEPPAFSEGPGDGAEVDADGDDDSTELPLPHLAELPVGETAAPGAPHRRRRRRRRRGRGHRQGLQPPAQEGTTGASRPRSDRLAGAGERREPGRHAPPPSFRDEPSRSPLPPPVVSDDRTADRGDQPQTVEAPTAAAGDQKKPKRRWWIRSFKG